jgi:hypothetical protein
VLDHVLPYLACPYCGAGPAAWHTDETALAARVRSLPARMTATVSVRVSVFRPAT